MKPRKSRTISQAAQPAPNEHWLTKKQAAAYLAIGPRRIEDLIRIQRWATRKEKLDGMRQASTMIKLSDLKAYRDGKRAPTLDHQTGQPLARRKEPARGAGSATPGAEALSQLATIASGQAQALQSAIDRMAQACKSIATNLQPNPPPCPPHRWLTLREAGEHIGLPPSYLRQACEEGRLAFISIGTGPRRRRMVRAEAAQQLDAKGKT